MTTQYSVCPFCGKRRVRVNESKWYDPYVHCDACGAGCYLSEWPEAAAKEEVV